MTLYYIKEEDRTPLSKNIDSIMYKPKITTNSSDKTGSPLNNLTLQRIYGELAGLDPTPKSNKPIDKTKLESKIMSGVILFSD
ncbi:MAG: hypothetical protein KC550_06645 [Nanoarchaeota archaeon]|nr:hypothetical protein [Nanoarchaeota archaeon]